jgi:predicted DNA-binding transcriptional regulator AlpA
VSSLMSTIMCTRSQQNHDRALLALAQPCGVKAPLTNEQIALQKLRAILSERELAEWLGISQPTLSRHRRSGTRPAYIRLSARRVGYRRDAVEAWLKRREQCALVQTERKQEVVSDEG